MKIWFDSSELIFGQRLKRMIKSRGYTQEQFADKIGITKPTLVKYISGKIDPPLSTFIKICNLLEVPYNYMLDGKAIIDPPSASVYFLLNQLGYPTDVLDDEQHILIEYNGKKITMSCDEIKGKTMDFLNFLLYQKSNEEQKK